MAPVEDNDSGMESQEGSQAQDAPSKEYSPEKKLELEMDYDEEVIQPRTLSVPKAAQLFTSPAKKFQHNLTFAHTFQLCCSRMKH
jgi:hypothetical protein